MSSSEDQERYTSFYREPPKLRTLSGNRTDLKTVLHKIKMSKPHSKFTDDVTEHRKRFKSSQEHLYDRLNYYYKTYGMLRVEENGKKTFYSQVENDYISFVDNRSFWEDLTSMIIQEGAGTLEQFI